VGWSKLAGWQIALAKVGARARHFLGLVSEQSIYNLIDRTIELEVIPACQGYGLGLIPWSPLKGGALGGVLKKAAEGRRTSDNTLKTVAKYRPQLEAYEKLCAEIGQHPADVGLAWLLSRPAVTAPIIGPRTIEQLDQSVRTLALKLEADVLGKLDAIFPGPGGAAPEAYAW
jgi:aryl-alcohol dehydrogenase-like predicted oxidoreductase